MFGSRVMLLGEIGLQVKACQKVLQFRNLQQSHYNNKSKDLLIKRWFAYSLQLLSQGYTYEVAKLKRSVKVAQGNSQVRF